MISLWIPLIVAPLLLAIRLVRRPRPLPPGPRRKPIIGNLFDVPLQNPFAAFDTWRKQYGDIVYLEVLGNSIVVLNGMDPITELFERRAGNYSHRPVVQMVGELMGINRSIGLNNNDKVWRQQRKLAAIALGPVGAKQYIPLQERLVALFLSELEERPGDFMGLCELAAARLILEITYGISIENMENPYIKEAEDIFELVRRGVQPGAYLVDFIPWLKHVPAWVPFSSQATAARGRAQVEAFVNRPFESVKTQMAANTARPSLVASLLSDRSDVEGLDFEEILKWAASTMYDAGGESTAITLKSFIMAMALHPEAQTMAQQELDTLLNGSRLPTLDDRASLPYVNVCIKEIYRWHVAIPLGLPRRAEKDDIYNGYLIPRGSIILPNIRGIAEEGDHLTRFTPEIHLNKYADGSSDAPDPLSYVFGFGRRACPGKLLAENSLFIFIASILTVFRITKDIDSDGNEIPIDPKFQIGLMSHPEPFKCRIVVRSPETKKLLANQLLDRPIRGGG
ncbi:cytochrome P450 [Mycena maculata]|uniref:Cytochrome P450 n=1 Tax=Mycena maculata TaxID=230809 RepID=A0AAD7KG07_9AGAR|nr:cytochrome P450 [Mycena maculata]